MFVPASWDASQLHPSPLQQPQLPPIATSVGPPPHGYASIVTETGGGVVHVHHHPQHHVTLSSGGQLLMASVAEANNSSSTHNSVPTAALLFHHQHHHATGLTASVPQTIEPTPVMAPHLLLTSFGGQPTTGVFLAPHQVAGGTLPVTPSTAAHMAPTGVTTTTVATVSSNPAVIPQGLVTTSILPSAAPPPYFGMHSTASNVATPAVSPIGTHPTYVGAASACPKQSSSMYAPQMLYSDRSAALEVSNFPAGSILTAVVSDKNAQGLLIGASYSGTVKRFNPWRGFGFIRVDTGVDIFFYHLAIVGSVDNVTVGTRVMFDVAVAQGYKQAFNIRVMQ